MSQHLTLLPKSTHTIEENSLSFDSEKISVTTPWDHLNTGNEGQKCEPITLTHLCPQVRFCTFFLRKIKSRPILKILGRIHVW